MSPPVVAGENDVHCFQIDVCLVIGHSEAIVVGYQCLDSRPAPTCASNIGRLFLPPAARLL